MARPITIELHDYASAKMDALGLPTEVIKLKLGAARHAFVYTLPARAREKMTTEQFEQTARALGDLVHPSKAVLLVLPDGIHLRAFEIKAVADA